MAIDYESSLKTLKTNTENTSEVILDLQDFIYAYDNKTHLFCLKTEDESEKFYFPENSVWALQQLCRMMKVPFNFFTKNPVLLKEDITVEWLPQVKNPDVLLKYRTVGESRLIRAVLPSNYVTVQNCEVFESLLNNLDRNKFDLEIFEGYGAEDIKLHFRVFSKQTFEIKGSSYRIGLVVVTSELDDRTPLQLNICVMDVSAGSSFITNFKTNDYYKQFFRGVLPAKLEETFEDMLMRLDLDAQFIQMTFTNNMLIPYDEDKIRRFFSDLKDTKGVSKRFISNLDLEISSCIQDYTTYQSLLNKMAEFASLEELDKRLKQEFLIGKLAGLDISSR